MKNFSLGGIAMVAILTGCASAPSVPQEPEISVQLQGTAVEVQNFIEQKFGSNPQTASFKVDSADDRSIVFKADCMNTPTMNAFKCAAIMMGVGNSGWDGPYAVMTFRTSEIRGTVNLTVTTQWCATNAFGKTNCMTDGNNASRNQILRAIESGYKNNSSPTK